MVRGGMTSTVSAVLHAMRPCFLPLQVTLIVALGFSSASCKGKTSEGKPAPTPVASSSAGSGSGSATLSDLMPETTYEKRKAAEADLAEAKKDTSKGDKNDSEWVPSEFKSGMARWKDVGVYVDGQPVGFLSWGELPIGCKPTWVKDKVSSEQKPFWRWAKQRMYKFTDYLKAIGINPGSVNQIHVYGAKLSQTVIATGKDLQSKRAEGFMFRFGTNVGGKAIPQVPEGFGNGKTPDKIAGVMIYIKKKPPTLIRNEGLELDGVMQTGVPYYGDPIRGGIRVYLDDKLAGIIKRQELDPNKAIKATDGDLRWKLVDVLAGKDLKKVVEIWVIRDERRAEKLPGSELATLTFSASAQAKGGVLLGDQRIRANAIALHTRALAESELPVVTPDDE
jgi:hypothetical protein